MPAIIVPPALPMPSVATLTPTERRLLTSLPGPRQARVQQRDFNAGQRIEWAVLNRAQVSLLRTWWHDDLFEGGAWFAATWPLPEGLVVGVRKFLAEPAMTYLGANKWRVSAQCEVRGRGELPQAPSSGAEIGWFEPVTGIFGTLAHANAGTADFGAFGMGGVLWAGGVGAPEDIEWSAIWEPVTEGEPSPVLAPDVSGTVQVTWLTATVPPEDDPFLFNPARGQLTLTATINGAPIATGQRIVAVVSTGVDYPAVAWGPEP